MYRLVIAEKPSVAQSIAKVLGAGARKDGFLEGGGWLVSWCVGHLAELAEPAVYNPAYDKWRKEDLPIVPGNWRFTIARDKREQFDTLRTLLRREDVSEVVNACDAGREGELIFRTVYHLAGCTKPMKRLWISSMEDSAIREGFENLRPGSGYDGLHQAALCRLKADWLVGINATRLFSVLYGRTLNVGRVVSPTLAMIVQREAEITAFEPKPFYTVELDCGNVILTGERFLGKRYAEEAAVFCADKPVVIQAVERREKSEKAPALYDLTTLQRDANRSLGYTAQQTLDYLQSLYEKKLCTYPRTDSRYLTDDMESAVPALVSAAVTICGVQTAGTISPAQVCDSKKVSDHHAVVPTASAAGADLDALPKGELAILRLVSLALVRAVCPPHRYAETLLLAECGGHRYTAKGKTVLDMGWRTCGALPKEQDSALPDGLAEGQTLAIEDGSVKEGTTTPPRHFTEDTLLASMECAGMEEMPEDAERKGIGTPVQPNGQVSSEDTALDEYPMPDPAYSKAKADQDFAYLEGYLLPLTKERAETLMGNDFSIYAIVNEYARMVFDREELDQCPPGIAYATPTEEWEASPDFKQAVAERMNHQKEREQAFLGHAGDCFAIYQIRDGEEQRDLRYMSMDWLISKGLTPERCNYDLVYTGEMAPGQGSSALERLWVKFNDKRPADYLRPSMSVSDIIAVKQDGVVSCHYCDSFGYAKVPDFIKPENYLKAAELSTEDDCNMIDGIINNGPKEPSVADLEAQVKAGKQISLMDLAAAVHRESGKKSVVSQLKEKPARGRQKAARKKNLEKER